MGQQWVEPEFSGQLRFDPEFRMHLNPGARKQWEHMNEVATTYRTAQVPDYEPSEFGTKVRAQLKRIDDLGIE